MSSGGLKSYASWVGDSSKSCSTKRCGISTWSLSSHFGTPLQRRKNIKRTEFNERRRIVFMGNAKVGKSSIIKRFLYNEFAAKYKRTVEEFYVADFKLSNGASLTLEMVDTTGSYDFPAMRDLAISKADAFVLVYSVGDVASWERIEELQKEISRARDQYIPIVIVGNKSDDPEVVRSIRKEEVVYKILEDSRCTFLECNAKLDRNVFDIFAELLIGLNIRFDLDEAVQRFRRPYLKKSDKRRYRSKSVECPIV